MVLHCEEVPESSTAIADWFASLGFSGQQRVNFHTHTKPPFVVPSMCESYGILSERKRIFSFKVYHARTSCFENLLASNVFFIWKIYSQTEISTSFQEGLQRVPALTSTVKSEFRGIVGVFLRRELVTG